MIFIPTKITSWPDSHIIHITHITHHRTEKTRTIQHPLVLIEPAFSEYFRASPTKQPDSDWAGKQSHLDSKGNLEKARIQPSACMWARIRCFSFSSPLFPSYFHSGIGITPGKLKNQGYRSPKPSAREHLGASWRHHLTDTTGCRQAPPMYPIEHPFLIAARHVGCELVQVPGPDVERPRFFSGLSTGLAALRAVQ